MSEQQHDITQTITGSESTAVSVYGDATTTVIKNYYFSEIRAGRKTAVVAESFEGVCPYKGLSAFSPADKDFFFGREKIVSRLIDKVNHTNFLGVVGASGSGKSSLVLAGVVPALVEQGNWEFTYFRPGEGSDAFHALAGSLVPIFNPELRFSEKLQEVHRLAENLREGALTLKEVAAEFEQRGKRLLLIANQFEELFTIHHENESQLISTEHKSTHTFQQQFLSCLLSVASEEKRSAVVVVATLRVDYLKEVLNFPTLTTLLDQNQFLLGAMDRDSLRSVIVKPAAKCGVYFEESLVDRLVSDVREEAGDLVLLEFTLEQLWERKVGEVITEASYEEIGGVQGALACYADRFMKRLTPRQKRLARSIFCQLVIPEEAVAGARYSKRSATRAELGETSWKLITQEQGLADSRLVVTNLSRAHKQETVEIVHEGLIRNWQWLRKLSDTLSGFRLWQERLRQQISLHENDPENGNLLSGKNLHESVKWLRSDSELVSNKEKTFIKKSLQNRSLKRIKGVLLVVVLLFLIEETSSHFHSILQGAQFQSAQKLQSIEDVKEIERQWTEIANAAEPNRLKRLASTVAVGNSLKRGPHLDTWVRDWFAFGVAWQRRHFSYLSIPLHNQRIPFLGMAASPHEAQLALIASVGGGIYDQTFNSIVSLEAGNCSFADTRVKVEYSPGGRYLLVRSVSEICIWNNQGRFVAALPFQIGSVAFSADESRLTVHKRYDFGEFVLPSVPFEVTELQARPNKWSNYQQGAFSRDAMLFAGYRKEGPGAENRIDLWDVQKARLLSSTPVFVRDEGFQDFRFTADGKSVVLHGFDGRVYLYDVAKKVFGSLLSWSVFDVAISPGKQFVATSTPGEVRIYSWPFLGFLRKFAIPNNEVTELSFSANDNMLFAAGGGGEGSGYSLSVGDLHPSVISAVSQPQSSRFAIRDKAGKLTIIDSVGSVKVAFKSVSQRGMPAFSGDGTVIAEVGDGASAYLWHTESGELIREFSVKSTQEETSILYEKPFSLTLSHTGKYLVTSQEGDNRIRVWQVSTGREIANFLLGTPYNLAHDEQSLFIIGEEGSVRRVDLIAGGVEETKVRIPPAAVKFAKIWASEEMGVRVVVNDVDRRTLNVVGDQVFENSQTFIYDYPPSDYRFNENGELVIVGFSRIKQWDPTKGDGMETLIELPPGAIYKGFANAGRLVLFELADNSTGVVELLTGNLFSVEACSHRFTSVYSAISQLCLSGDGGVSITNYLTAEWAFEREASPVILKNISSHTTYGVVASPDGRVSLISAEDDSVKTIDTGSLVFGTPAVANNGSFALVGLETVSVWNVAGELVNTIPLAGDQLVQPVVFSPQGTRVLLTSGKELIVGACKEGERVSYEGTFIRADFLDENRLLVITGEKEGVEIWDVTGGARNIERLSTSDHTVFASWDHYHFASRGTTVAVTTKAFKETRVRLFFADGKTSEFKIPIENLASVAFSADGKSLIFASREGLLEQWGLAGTRLTQINLESSADELLALSQKGDFMSILNAVGDEVDRYSLSLVGALEEACKEVEGLVNSGIYRGVSVARPKCGV